MQIILNSSFMCTTKKPLTCIQTPGTYRTCMINGHQVRYCTCREKLTFGLQFHGKDQVRTSAAGDNACVLNTDTALNESSSNYVQYICYIKTFAKCTSNCLLYKITCGHLLHGEQSRQKKYVPQTWLD